MAVDNREFEEFVRSHEPRLRRFVHTTVSDSSTVDDVLQSAFFTAWKKFDVVRGLDERAVFPWLCGTAIRHVSNERRASTRRNRRAARLAGERIRSIEPNHDDESVTIVDLRTSLMRLPPDTRMILLLVLWDDAGPDQIAHAFGCTREAAAKRIQRSLTSLRKELGDER